MRLKNFLLLGFSILLVSLHSPAVAELRLSLKPDPITATTSSIIAIEKSSLRLDISIIYPDALRTYPENSALDDILNTTPSFDMSTAKKTAAQHFSIGVAGENSINRGSSKRITSLAEKTDLFQMVSAIHEKDWRGYGGGWLAEEGGGPVFGPPPEVVFLIEVDLPSAHAVINALDSELRNSKERYGDELDLLEYNDEAIGWMQTTLRKSRMLDIKRASNAPYKIEPLELRSRSALGWLYEAMLSLTSRSTSAAASRPLSECVLNDQNIIYSLEGNSENPIERFYVDLITDDNAGFSAANRLGLAVEWRDEINYFRTPLWLGSRLIFDQWIREGAGGALGELGHSLDYMSLVLSARIDPALIDIYDCAASIRNQGITLVSGSIFERKIGYRRMNKDIERIGPAAPKFFKAAETVTNLIGVGFVDALDATDISPYFGLINDHDNSFIDESCARFELADALIPGDQAKEILRRINSELYSSVNMPMMLRLQEIPSGADVHSFPDPLTDKTLSTDLHPMFPSMGSSGLIFDLRMVIAEQSFIRRELPNYLDISTNEGKKIAAELDRAQSALFCLQLKEVLTSNDAVSHLEIIRNTGKMLNAVIQNGVIAKENAVFSNYWWRVATGSAMVMILHDRDEAEFINYIKTLIEWEAKKGAEKELKNLPPQKLDRVKKQLERPLSSLGPASVALRRGAEILLDEDFDDFLFWGCDNGVIVRTPIDGTLLSNRQEAIWETGGMALVLAYELGPDGALDANATPIANDKSNCEAFGSRRSRLESAISILPLQAPTTLWSTEQPLVIFERSLAMRKVVGQFQYFITNSKDLGIPLTSIGRVMKRIATAHQEAQYYERRIVFLDTLAGAKPNPIKSLGLSEDVLKLLASHFDEVYPSVGMKLVGEGADPSTFWDTFSSAQRAAEIQRFAEELAIAFAPLETAWKTGQNSLEPPQLSPERFPVLPFLADQFSNSPKTGPDIDLGALSGLSLPGALGIDIVSDNSGNISGDLLLRLPDPRAPLASGASGNCQILVADTDLADSPNKCSSHISVIQDGNLSQSNVQRLGFKILNLKSLEECDLQHLENCNLSFTGADAQDNILLDGRAFQEALRRINIPDFIRFDPHRINGLLISDDLLDISVAGILTVAGFRLDVEDTMIPLREGGAWTNFTEAFIEASAETIDKQLSAKFAKAQAFLDSLRLPVGSDEELNFRFGPAVDPNGDLSIHVALDWKTAQLNMRMIYALEARATLETPWQDALSLRAGVELALGPEGMERQRIIFDTPDKQDILDQISSFPIFDYLREASDGLITVTPQVVRGDLRLRIATLATIDGCPVEIATSVGLDLKKLKDDFNDVKMDLKNQAVGCAQALLAKSANDIIEEQTVDILGVPFIVSIDGETLTAEKLMESVPLTFTLQDGATSVDGPLGACSELGAEQSIEGIKFKVNPLSFDFRGMDSANQNLLGTMVGCRIDRVVPTSLKPYFSLSNIAVGHNLIAADISLNNAPMLGTLALPRLNFSNMDTDISELMRDALGAAAAEKLGETIYDQLGGDDGIDLAGVGKAVLKKDTVKTDIFSDDPKVMASVTLIVYDIPVSADIEIAFARGSDALRVTIDGDKALETAFQGVIGKVLEFVPQETIEVSNPRFGRLDDAGRSWGFVFGLKAEIPTTPGLIVGASRITISENGVSLGNKITGGASAPIPMGPVALSKVLISLYTGEDGRDPGVEVGADITAFDPSLAHLVKLRALLNLREIKKPKFTIKGDLIVFNTLEVFKTTGTLDLSLMRATVDAQTTDFLRDIIDYPSKLDADGSEKRFLAESSLAVLGVKLNTQEIVFCVEKCDDGSGREHTAQLKVWKNFLIGKGNVNAVTDLDFRDPQLGSNIELNLFGWSPGHANFSADLRRVRVGMRFLGVDLQAQTPSIKTMTPQLLIDMLKALFDISLEDLLNIKPDNISISVMSGDGSTQTIHDGSKEGTNSNASEASDGSGPTVETSVNSSALPAQESSGTRPSQGEGESGPQPTPWGRSVQANICIKEFGTPGNRSFNDPDVSDARYYINSWNGQGQRPQPFERVREPWPGGSWWSLYTQNGIQALCDPLTFQLKEAVVGTNQNWRRNHCSDGFKSRYSFAEIQDINPGDNPVEPVPGLLNLSTQLVCSETNNWWTRIWATWFLDENGDSSGGKPSYIVVPLCPNGEAMDELSSVSPMAGRACDRGVIRIPLNDEVPRSMGVDDVIHADDLYQLEVTHLRPRLEGLDVTRKLELYSPFGTQNVRVDEIDYSVNLYRETEGETTLRWHFKLSQKLQYENGKIVHEVLPLVLDHGDPLSDFRDRPQVMKRILSIWLEQGRRPTVVGQQKSEYLVIATTYDESDEKSELHEWLWQPNLESNLSVRRVIFPLIVPITGGFARISEGASTTKQKVLDGLWEEVKRLPNGAGNWELLLGLNNTTRSQTFAFLQSDEADDPIVHLVLNATEPRIFSIDELWNPQRDSSLFGEQPIAGDQKRRCSTVNSIGKTLSNFRDEAFNPDSYEDFVRQALTDPHGYNSSPHNLRNLPEPLVMLPLSNCPEIN
ncbi:MAG: hypothetical protein AB8G77_21190 [Rhodothermales bacterium]